MKRSVGIILTATVTAALVGVFSYTAVRVTANVEKPAQVAPNTVSQQVKPPTVQELLTLVNAERQKNGVAPLTLDERLNQSAQRKADDETTYNYFGHISPHDGKHGYEYISDTGIYCATDSENLTDNTIVNDSTHAVNAWIASAPHHKAMIDSNYTLTGFGISGIHVVEHFCQQ